MTKTSKQATAFFGTLAVISITSFFVDQYNSQKETVAQRTIVKEVKGLIEECRSAGAHVTITGKVLVWEIRNDRLSGAYYKLTGSLHAKSNDKPITVFMVLGERNELGGTYSISRQPAYRQYTDIAVAIWPDKKAVGFYSVVSTEPRSSRPVAPGPEYGDLNERIANWIQTLVHDGR